MRVIILVGSFDRLLYLYFNTSRNPQSKLKQINHLRYQSAKSVIGHIDF